MPRFNVFAILLLGLLQSTALRAQNIKTLEIDREHSQVSFVVEAKCRGFLPGGETVEGSFSDFSGQIQYSTDNPMQSKINIAININSILTKTTNQSGCVKILPNDDKTRDGHLKNSDFFDSASFPKATFKTLNITQTGDNQFSLKGKLSMRGLSNTIDFSLKPLTQYKDAQNRQHLSFEARTKFDRKVFGVGPESGEITGPGAALIAVQDQVELTIHIDAYEVTK